VRRTTWVVIRLLGRVRVSVLTVTQSLRYAEPDPHMFPAKPAALRNWSRALSTLTMTTTFPVFNGFIKNINFNIYNYKLYF
jgi:hypothetical protein